MEFAIDRTSFKFFAKVFRGEKELSHIFNWTMNDESEEQEDKKFIHNSSDTHAGFFPLSVSR